MQPIKNIIFDLGGVFLTLDFKKTENAFAEFGVTNFPEMYTQHHASDLFELLETGKISPQGFYEKFRAESKTNISNENIQHAWNAMLLDFPLERIHWLDEVRSRYQVFLFSNTNQIHYHYFSQMFSEKTNGKNFNSHFIKAYYSHEMGLRKPYPESFMHIIQEQQLLPAETLFIDDTLKNIESAKQTGLQTLHLVHPQTLLDVDL